MSSSTNENLNTECTIAGVKFKNPVTTASGTFAAGKEYSEYFDLGKLGAVTVKGVSDVEWKGNPSPRVTETYGGMLNAVGLQNLGVENFIQNDLPYLRKYDTKVIVNVCGHSVQEYVNVVKALEKTDVDLLELNISCPNLSEGGLAFGTDVNTVEKIVYEVKQFAKQPLIVKLSPNVTDIVAISKAAERGGADGLSLINTLLGMQIDIKKRKPVLGNKMGGLSGPAVKPVAIRMVYQVAKNTDLPIIGMGGIMTGNDAIEFIMAGATMVAVGTANFNNPYATVKVVNGIKEYMLENGVKDLSEIRGCV